MSYVILKLRIPIKILEEIMKEKPDDVSLSLYILDILKNRKSVYDEKYQKLAEWEKNLELREKILAQKEKEFEVKIIKPASEIKESKDEQEHITEKQKMYIKDLINKLVQKTGNKEDDIIKTVKQETKIDIFDLDTLTRGKASKVINFLSKQLEK